MSVQLICDASANRESFSRLADRWQLVSDPQSSFALVQTAERLELRNLAEPKLGAIFVDFVGGVMAHRRRFGGGRGEAVAKAVGIKGDYLPKVVDATAGLGRDAFVLASLGCEVRMLERHPVVAALLDDGLQRGYRDPQIGGWLQTRLSLLHVSSLTALSEWRSPELPFSELRLSELQPSELQPSELRQAPDVVYLDPMYPHRQKSALVKKEMRIFQTLVGADDDADALLLPALALATRRVVVKRPDYAEPLAGIVPQAEITTKNHRFDLYLKAAFSTP